MSKRKFSLLRRRAEFNTHYTVLDIGTEFVKALIVKREDDKGIVIGASRIRQQLTDMQGGAVADIQSVIDNCRRAPGGAAARPQGGGAADVPRARRRRGQRQARA